MIDIPGVYVGRFKDNPNNRPALMTRAATPTYTDDNWANVESTGTIWRYNAETGEWVDTGLEEILVEEVTGTKEIVAEGTVPWNFQGLKVYGKSTQDGIPSPENPVPIVSAGESGTISVTVSDGADQNKQLAISTPNGLPGIPVDSGGNFIDETGQQWVCDEVDFEKGVYVQRVNKFVLTSNLYIASMNPYSSVALDTVQPFRVMAWVSMIRKHSRMMSENFECANPWNNPLELAWTVEHTVDFNVLNERLGTSKETSGEDAVAALKVWLADNSLTFLCQLVTPIETPLSAEELAAYAALMSYDGITVISTDENISGMSAKVVTDVISKNAWFDPYSELALYYKALAGFASLEDLPMPHSRESSLVRKLLDPDYELEFSVNENSSRNERYLWDLINGTTSMLTNIPKSDTEKFLHVMIGGTVEEYPTVDTELDYWMDKCVNYMSSNGSIGE